jgi:hypothetical protein
VCPREGNVKPARLYDMLFQERSIEIACLPFELYTEHQYKKTSPKELRLLRKPLSD